MASDPILTILEQSQVSPPPATVTNKLRTQALNFSNLITLQHFFPFVGKLFIYPDPKKPEIRYVEGDSLAVTFAESDQDFDDLSGNHPRDCDKFYHLIPLLGQPEKTSNYTKLPIFAVQVTRGYQSLDLVDESFLANGTLPIYDRVEENQKAAESFLKFAKYETLKEDYEHQILSGSTDKVRATFVLTRNVLNQLKKSVTELPTLAHVSSFTVACVMVWSNHLANITQ
ncbi:malonyl-coenzyme A:anthocyanin 3-O-glucoside-6''-O-malonyltransferase-like protein [Tanacetum coccineum]